MNLSRSWPACSLALALVAFSPVGCVPSKRNPPKAEVKQETEVAAKEDAKQGEPKVDEPKLPQITVGAALDQAAQHIAKGEMELAKKTLEPLAVLRHGLEPAHLAELNRLAEILDRPVPTPPAKEPAELAEARKLAAAEKWDEALKVLAPVLAKGTDNEAGQQAAALRDQIERQVAGLRELREAVAKLGGSGPEVEEARTRLWRDSDRSLPLLLAGLSSDNPLQLGGILEILRMRNEPAALMPAVLGVLERPEAGGAWPVAIEELGRLRQPGAGEKLLKLALEAKTPQQRVAALTALAAAVDPPPKTLQKLLPTMAQDGPELPAALEAAAWAAIKNRQMDLVTARVIRDGSLSDAERKQLAALPGRLGKLTEGLKASPRPAAAVPAAMLAAALGISKPPALSGLRVVACSGEEVNGPADAVLDGVWHNYEARARSAWYDVGSIPTPWLILDLGEERTVAGLRIWNCDGPGGLADRGWREFDIYVTNDLSEAPPVASGFLSKAPGRKEGGDFSDTVAVPFARGRYVKLQARSIWTDQYSGLSEVQVLGW